MGFEQYDKSFDRPREESVTPIDEMEIDRVRDEVLDLAGINLAVAVKTDVDKNADVNKVVAINAAIARALHRSYEGSNASIQRRIDVVQVLQQGGFSAELAEQIYILIDSRFPLSSAG